MITNEQFKALVEQYEKLVFTICYQMVRDYHEAQNLTQDTFVSAFRHLERAPPEQLRPWLARIATNKAKDYLKSAYIRRVSAEEDTLLLLPSLESVEGSLLEAEGLEEIAQAIHSLSEPYLKVSILHFLKEQSVEEIARQLDRPPKTVQTQLYRARRMLQPLLRKEERT